MSAETAVICSPVADCGHFLDDLDSDDHRAACLDDADAAKRLEAEEGAPLSWDLYGVVFGGERP